MSDEKVNGVETLATPRPWNDLRVGREGDGSALSYEAQLCNADGVAALLFTHDGSEEAHANVALLMRAVNARDELVTEVGVLRAQLTSWRERSKGMETALSAACQRESSLRAIVEALTTERDVLRELADRRGRLLNDTMTVGDAMQAYARVLISAPPHGNNCMERGGTIAGRQYLLTIQWHDGKTPLTLHAEVLAERDAAVSQREALAAAVREEREAREDHDRAGRSLDGDRFAAADAHLTHSMAALDAALAGCP